MNATVRVYGIQEVNKAFRQIDKSLAGQLGADLKEAAAPVVAAAKGKEKWRGASINTIVSRRTGLRVFVYQNAPKVTGKRGDYGALQMRQALEPALDENADEVYSHVERVLDRYANEAGF